MVNFFDQYDPPSETAVAAPPLAGETRNFFDQYDPPPATVASPAVAMPPPIGTDEFGTPIFDTETPEGKQAASDARRGPEKVLEGVTMGILPHIEAAATAMGGVPYSQGLQDARDFTTQTTKDNLIASALSEGAGSLIPALGLFGAATPAVAAAGRAIPYVGSAMARALIGAGLGGASAAGHDIGSGETGSIGSDTVYGAGTGALLSSAGDLAGAGVQAVPNMASGLLQGVRNISTNAGREGVVGQILREAGGGFQNQTAVSPISGLTLRAAQSTGNPGIASLEDAMALQPGIQDGPLGSKVTNGRTPDQSAAIARSLVGSDAGIEPTTLVNQASSRGVSAIQNTNDALSNEENAAWNSMALKGVRLNGPALARSIDQDVTGLPASWRDSIIGSQGKLAPFMTELNELKSDASIQDINSIRSRVLGVVRDVRSGPQPDSVTASAGNKLADSILDRIGQDPAMTGTPSQTTTFPSPPPNNPPTQSPAGITVFRPQPQTPVPITIPGAPPNTAAWNAYAHARDFTRNFNQAKGYNEFDNILHPNNQGNMQGNPEKQFGQFFDMTGGTSSGLERLKGLVDFARQSGLNDNASELEGATGQYLKSAVLKQARAGNGLDATDRPATNLSTLESTANKLAPALSGSIAASVAPDIQAAGNAASLVNRPSVISGGTNSKTYERLKNNDLVSAIIGQSGSSALGAAAGGYGGYKAGEPFGVPASVSIPAGMLAGAAGGRFLGPVAGKAISHIPGASAAITGPSNAIQKQLWQALMDTPSYNRSIATPMISGPSLGQPGIASATTSALARALMNPAARNALPTNGVSP